MAYDHRGTELNLTSLVFLPAGQVGVSHTENQRLVGRVAGLGVPGTHCSFSLVSEPHPQSPNSSPSRFPGFDAEGQPRQMGGVTSLPLYPNSPLFSHPCEIPRISKVPSCF